MKLLIWDFDGTLAFRHGMWSAALAEVAQTKIPGCRARAADFAPHLASGFFWHRPDEPHTYIESADAWWQHLSPVLARAFAEVTSVTYTEALALVPRVRASYTDPARWEAFPDASCCLSSLSAASWQHVLLSNHVPELPQLVNALGLAHHFLRIFNSADLGYEKPHPEAFRAVLSAFPATSAVQMVGDNHRADIEGAQAVGISAILVRKPYPGALRYHESLASLPAALA